MLYPFIYTRTKYHDYRVVTSKSIVGLPHYVVHIFTEIARTMIDAENNQLIKPSWALVKKNDYTLWGMAILNEVLGDKGKDKTNRPVRGFFGFISDNQINRLPYSISYFKEIYNAYVMPIWDSLEQTEQINCQLPPISGDEFITKSLRLNNDINVELEICRVFPYGSDCTGLIEAVFASSEDCSIATNVHKKSRCIEFGNDKLSFMNVVMSSDSSIRDKDDIKVFVKKRPIVPERNPFEKSSDQKDETNCAECGNSVNDDEQLCSGCKEKQHTGSYLKHGLYVFLALICIVLVVKGPGIWEKILSPEYSQETTICDDDISENHSGDVNITEPFFNTKKTEIIIKDAMEGDEFRIEYESSSAIKNVITDVDWIRIITEPQQYAKRGEIIFICDPLDHGFRDGVINMVNEEGEKKVIPIRQTITDRPETESENE